MSLSCNHVCRNLYNLNHKIFPIAWFLHQLDLKLLPWQAVYGLYNLCISSFATNYWTIRRILFFLFSVRKEIEINHASVSNKERESPSTMAHSQPHYAINYNGVSAVEDYFSYCNMIKIYSVGFSPKSRNLI